MADAPSSSLAQMPKTFQCEGGNIFPYILFIVLHYASAFIRQSGGRRRRTLTAVVAAMILVDTVYMFKGRRIKALSMGHLFVASICFEFALRFAKEPLYIVRSRPEFLFVCVCNVPFLIQTISETFMPFHAFKEMPHFTTFQSWSHIYFFEKQHALIHGSVAMMLASFASSYFTRLRRSPQVQLARTFLDPACMVSIVAILMTHDHGAGSAQANELATHPAIGVLLFLAALCQTISAIVHFSWPRPDGEPPDLSTPLPGGGPTPLTVLRLTTSFAFLLVNWFLYIDTLMEYMGCRLIMIKVGDEHDTARLGWSPASEVSSYQSAAFLSAVLAFSCVIVPLFGGDFRPPAARSASVLPECHEGSVCKEGYSSVRPESWSDQ